jgi:hypothetical protein
VELCKCKTDKRTCGTFRGLVVVKTENLFEMKASGRHVLCFILKQTVQIFQYFCQFIEVPFVSNCALLQFTVSTVSCAL